jgi:predicted enzyme related to lactoylglutathione lyase
VLAAMPDEERARARELGGRMWAGAARARDEGRFDPATDPEGAAIQMWAMATAW